MNSSEKDSILRRVQDYRRDPEMGAAWFRWGLDMVEELVERCSAAENEVVRLREIVNAQKTSHETRALIRQLRGDVRKLKFHERGIIKERNNAQHAIQKVRAYLALEDPDSLSAEKILHLLEGDPE